MTRAPRSASSPGRPTGPSPASVSASGSCRRGPGTTARASACSPARPFATAVRPARSRRRPRPALAVVQQELGALPDAGAAAVPGVSAAAAARVPRPARPGPRDRASGRRRADRDPLRRRAGCAVRGPALDRGRDVRLGCARQRPAARRRPGSDRAALLARRRALRRAAPEGPLRRRAPRRGDGRAAAAAGRHVPGESVRAALPLRRRGPPGRAAAPRAP